MLTKNIMFTIRPEDKAVLKGRVNLIYFILDRERSRLFCLCWARARAQSLDPLLKGRGGLYLFYIRRGHKKIFKTFMY